MRVGDAKLMQSFFTESAGFKWEKKILFGSQVKYQSTKDNLTQEAAGFHRTCVSRVRSEIKSCCQVALVPSLPGHVVSQTPSAS